MKQYLNVIEEILSDGCLKEGARKNMPRTVGISNAIIKMDLEDGFPLLTTKKMYWKGIVHELLWFLRGDTNIKYLVDNNVNIWNKDAYRWYNEEYVEKFGAHEMTMEEFIENVKRGVKVFLGSNNIYLDDIKLHNKMLYTFGDLGKVYGYQWRNQNGVDQIKELIDGLKTNPYSRYHILDSWNKADHKHSALPPCHLLYHFIVRPIPLRERLKYCIENVVECNDRDNLEEILDNKNVPKFYLDLNMYQRSSDSFLGLPFNLASMSLFLMIVAKTVNMIPSRPTWIGGDTHIYEPHISVANEILEREPMKLPEMLIKKELNSVEDIENLRIEDFELIGYESHPTIKAELFTGI